MGLSPSEVRHPALDEKFIETWADYSRRAESNKTRYKFHRLLSRPVLHISWLMLLLAVGAMFAPETRLTDVVPYLVPAFSGLTFALAFWQLLSGYRESWILYRTATEHLRQAHFRYRLGLWPFAGPDAPRELERELARVNKFVHETNESPPGPVVTLWRLWHMRLTAETTAQHDGRPSTLDPRFAAGDATREDVDSFLFSSMHDQQRWHYERAKTYLLRFILLQVLVLAASGVGMWLSWKLGPQLWIMGLIGAANVLMIYIGDFFDLGALFQRYYYVVAELRRLGHEYQVAEGPFAGLEDDARRKRLAAEVDHVLAREFDYWHARAGKSPKDRPASALDFAMPNAN